MFADHTHNKAARLFAMAALVLVLGGLQEAGAGAAAQTVRGGALPSLASTASEPTSTSSDADSVTGKLGVHITDRLTGGPVVGLGFWVEDLNMHVVDHGITDASGYYAVLLPPGGYYVDLGAWPSRCGGWVEGPATIIADHTTTVRGAFHCYRP